MSAYELDDEAVRLCLHNSGAGLPQYLYKALSEQLPPLEPDREYLVKDAKGAVWRWSARQVAWECTENPDAFCAWETLQAAHGPLLIYGPVS